MQGVRLFLIDFSQFTGIARNLISE
jgi:hypothetical protein